MEEETIGTNPSGSNDDDSTSALDTSKHCFVKECLDKLVREKANKFRFGTYLNKISYDFLARRRP